MKIIFTRHAKLRCIQRKVPEQWVTFHLQRIPLSSGTHEHLIEGTKLIVVYHDGVTNRYVITLYPEISFKEDKQVKKHVDLTPFKDLLSKENEKYIRRKKKSKKNKFKKR